MECSKKALKSRQQTTVILGFEGENEGQKKTVMRFRCKTFLEEPSEVGLKVWCCLYNIVYLYIILYILCSRKYWRLILIFIFLDSKIANSPK